MIDLTKNSLPSTITVGGREYSIYTDFRVWLKFEQSLVGAKVDDQIDVGYLFPGERPTYMSIASLLAFARPPKPLPRPVRGTSSAGRVIDFDIDGDLIFAAFWQQYRIDLTEIEELHWHKFLALLYGLKGTKLDEVMGYRCYEKQTHKDIDPYEELREAWELEDPDESDLSDEELDAFNKLCTPEDKGG